MKTSYLLGLLMLGAMLFGCAKKEEVKPSPPPKADPGPPLPKKIDLVAKPLLFQDQTEPIQKRVDFEFDLPKAPRRARLVLRYTGVPAALSEDYKMGRFRHKLELNDRFLMDLNTYSEGQERVVEYTKWLSVLMLKPHNKLSVISGDDGNREGDVKIDPWELRAAHLEFDW